MVPGFASPTAKAMGHPTHQLSCVGALEHIARLHSLSPACEVIRTTKTQPSQAKSLLMADHILGRYRTINVVDTQEVVAGLYRTDVTIMSRLITGSMGC